MNQTSLSWHTQEQPPPKLLLNFLPAFHLTPSFTWRVGGSAGMILAAEILVVCGCPGGMWLPVVLNTLQEPDLKPL